MPPLPADADMTPRTARARHAGPPSETMAQPAVASSETAARPVRPPMTFMDRALASIAGSVITSLTTTPLDVVKTRLQTQSAAQQQDARYILRAAHVGPAQGPPCPVHATVPHATGAASSRVRWLRPASAYVMSLDAPASTLCLYPHKCSMAEVCEAQVIFREGRMTGMADGLLKIVQVEGWRSLWRGVVPTLAMTVPSQVIYMSFYDTFRRSLRSLSAPTSRDETSAVPRLGVSLVSGAMARAIAATAVTPLELLRTRLQASHARASSFRSVLQPLYEDVQRGGVRVLWRGLSATLWRDVPFSAIYFTGYEGGKVLLTGSGFGESQSSTFWHEFGLSFLAGGGSGMAAAVVTHPFDLIKTRLQAVHGASAPSSSVAATLRHIVETDGWTGLFRGLSPRLAKTVPACGIMIGVFEAVSRSLVASRTS